MLFALFLLVAGAAAVAMPFALLWAAHWHRRLLRALAVAWAVATVPPYALVALVPDTAFAANWAKCGSLPVAASNFAAGDWYDLPGDTDYGPSVFVTQYFCSAGEAERAGYHRGLGRY